MRALPTFIIALAGLTGCTGPALTGLDLQTANWAAQESGSDASLRGLCVVSESVAWASGAGGTVLRTTDGGATWSRCPIPFEGADTLDYRDVHAFDADCALVISAGLPARIYRTVDGGATWNEVYANDQEGVFFDALAFWDDTHGLAFSDPVDGRLLIIATDNGGRSWTEIDFATMPPALPGEGGFAASGTCLAVAMDAGGRRHAWIGLGGATEASGARVFHSDDGGRNWSVIESPLRTDAASGIFSLAFENATRGVMVGGDYQRPDAREAHIACTTDGGRSWMPIAGGGSPRGYRSVVCYLPRERAYLAGGPSGVDVSQDAGRTWTRLSDEGFHTISVAPDGSVIWAAGSDGRIARLTREP